MPLLGTWPTTQACDLTGNQTSDPLVCRLALNPLSHTNQGSLWELSRSTFLATFINGIQYYCIPMTYWFYNWMFMPFDFLRPFHPPPTSHLCNHQAALLDSTCEVIWCSSFPVHSLQNCSIRDGAKLEIREIYIHISPSLILPCTYGGIAEDEVGKLTGPRALEAFFFFCQEVKCSS